MPIARWVLPGVIAAGALSLHESAASSRGKEIDTIELPPRAFVYRQAGEFSLAGRPVNAPQATILRSHPLRIMTRQVSAAEYQRCVAAGACRPNGSEPSRDLPAVNVSFEDATSYARWLSEATGVSWRLPTDEEWAFAAGSRFHDDALPVAASADPSRRWLARYEREAAGVSFGRQLRRVGAFGANEFGVVDLSGNVWEWTSTCFSRRALDRRDGSRAVVNCGVRVVEGQHRTYVTDFIRDASAGGCAAGTPPSNLGFRLVRNDATVAARLAARLCAYIGHRLGCEARGG